MKSSHVFCGMMLFFGMALVNPAKAEILAPSHVDAGSAFELQEADRPVTLTLSSPGDDTFTERFCSSCFGWQCVVYDTHVVHVTSAGPGVRPDQLSTKIQDDYEVRTGDFNNNGYLDVLIDRLTPGQIDASLQSVIPSQNAGGLTAEVPSVAELSHARTCALDRNITREAVDMNEARATTRTPPTRQPMR